MRDAAVQATDEGLRAILNALPAMVGYWDAACRNKMANDVYVEYFGRTPEEMRGMHISEVLGPELYAKNRPFIERALSGEAQLFDRMIVDTRGVPRHTQASYIPDVVEGRVRGFFVLVTDITPRKRAEQALADQTERLATILDAVSDGVVSLGGDLRITGANRVAESICGRTDLEGVPVERVLPGPVGSRADRHLGLGRELRHVLATGEARTLADVEPLVRPDGSQVTVEYLLAPVRSGDGAPSGVVMTVRDVTVQHRQAAERRQMLERLQAVNTELESFASMVAHDLKNPLHVIASFGDVMLERLPEGGDPLLRQAASRIAERARQASTVIDDLLEYAYLGGAGEPEPVRLGSVVDDAFSAVADEAARTGAVLSRSEMPTVLGQSAPLRQVFVNLVTNALRYRAPARPPSVQVSWARGPGPGAGVSDEQVTVQVRVVDNGIGIPPADVERVFSPGVHGHQDADGVRGTGLGLAACRLVVNRMGGRIWVDPANGAPGTVMVIELLPVDSGAVAEPGPEPPGSASVLA